MSTYYLQRMALHAKHDRWHDVAVTTNKDEALEWMQQQICPCRVRVGNSVARKIEVLAIIASLISGTSTLYAAMAMFMFMQTIPSVLYTVLSVLCFAFLGLLLYRIAERRYEHKH